MSRPAPPPAAEILETIRTSSDASRVKSNIGINDAAVDSFLQYIEKEDWDALAGAEQHGIRLPLKFDSPEEELNMLSVISIFNFLSGYRTALHRLTGRGAWDTILSLLLSSHLASDPLNTPLSTKGLLSATPASVASLTQIQTHREEDHPTMGSAVKVGIKDEEAWEILELLCDACHSTGKALQKEGMASLGAWVKGKLIETEGDSGKMIEALVSTFPAFNDCYEIDGQPVYLYKKALFLLSTVHHAFSAATPPPSFPVPSNAGFPVFVDNVLPTLILHFNLISTSSSTDPALTPGALNSNPLLSTESAARLRAASIAACARVAERAQSLTGDRAWLSDMTEDKLDAYLWNLGKKGELRQIVRVAEKGTVMY